MTPDEVHEYYGSIRKAAAIIGISRNSFYYWIKSGKIPLDRQKKYEELTNGELKLSENSNELYSKKEIILPNFRYFCEKLGMCQVRSLTFRYDHKPSIIYFSPNKKSITCTSFNSDNLMQAYPYFDRDGRQLFQKDVVEAIDSKKQIIILSLLEFFTNQLQSKEFIIMGNIFERKKNGHKGSKQGRKG